MRRQARQRARRLQWLRVSLFGVATLVAMSGVVAALAVQGLPPVVPTMTVTVQGRVVDVPAPRHRLEVRRALSAAGVKPRDGALLSARRRRVLDPRLHPATVTVDGRAATMTTRLRKRSVVKIIDGVDEVEPVQSRPEALRNTGLPEVERVLWNPGVPGVDEVTRGRASGEEVGRVSIVAPTPARAMTENVVSLTFDDGPDPAWTPRVLQILAEEGVTATFCVLGITVDAHPDLLREIARAGHTLCDHTVHHDMRLDQRSPETIYGEIDGGADRIRDLTGRDPGFYRPPGGTLSRAIVDAVNERGLRVLGWSVDSGDFRKPPPVELRDRVLADVKPGAIVLMHDGGGDRASTVDALREVIHGLKAAGYGFAVPQPTPPTPRVPPAG